MSKTSSHYYYMVAARGDKPTPTRKKDKYQTRKKIKINSQPQGTLKSL